MSNFKENKKETQIKQIGYINQDTQASKVYDINGIAPTLSAGTHGYANGYIKIKSNTKRYNTRMVL